MEEDKGWPITVHIRLNETGEIREYKTHTYDDGFSDFIWAEGNYACDCNRSLFFYNYNEPEEQKCGHEKFTITKIVRDETGEILYSEVE